MDFVEQFLYSCDHEGFLSLTQETWQNRWFPNQISLTADIAKFHCLNKTECEFYRFLFSFLGFSEKLVNFNIEGLIKEFHSHDMEHYYAEQIAMENIHGKVYANILNMFFNNNIGELKAYATKILNDRALQDKLHWLHKRVADAKTRAEKVLLFLLIEGIFFISSFYCIALLRVKGIMNGVCLANDYISRDEWIHTRAAALLYNTLVPPEEKPRIEWIHDLFKEAVDVEAAFIECKGSHLSKEKLADIRQFLQATADRILKSINLSPIYRSVPPLDCPLVYVGCKKNVNFFERESSDYTTAVANDL
ncbi:ribonucleotide reductase small subunit [Harp seal herpesvirus]|uniref:ribonucleoside-diphosphate reductase n=1 Tax=phocid gammaherpesvirus 3 TaxID=2560643 RepID=A0A0R5ZE51_9GAMA|nr:ribonucleotide reductase small subunit [Harp seal herpesvirus]AJG42987.1 ribonucleotide reductase small subunit [Harp seal herpesvirus]